MNAENKPNPQYVQRIENIQAAAKRGANLVKRMMVFSRQRNMEPEITNLNALILDTHELLKRCLGESILIKTNLSDDLWNVNIDPIMFEHILINMSVNARDAMPNGGILKITTENLIIDSENNQNDLKPGSYTVLTITDSGIGMPEDILEKIFTPFFTTKEVGSGTGLGLSMVYSFVKGSGGVVTAESSYKHGTKFYIYLPTAGGKTSGAPKPKIHNEANCGGNETILMVEDEQEILGLTSDYLQGYGYNVIKAENADQAMKIITKDARKIDLLFTDIVMPGDMNGVELASKAQIINARMKLLFTTGYAAEAVPDLELVKNHAMIDKPYHTTALLEKIRRILDGRDSRAA